MHDFEGGEQTRAALWGDDERLRRLEQMFGAIDLRVSSSSPQWIKAIDEKGREIVLTPSEIRGVIALFDNSKNLTNSERASAIEQHSTDQGHGDLWGHVYFLQGIGTNWVKIGRTTHLDKRVKQISPKVPFELKLVHSFHTPDCDRLEAWFHERYAAYRGQGEWFALHEEVLDEIRAMAPYNEGTVPEESGHYMTMTDAACIAGEFDHLSDEKKG